MGCGTETFCVDCKTAWYCGYGSYGRHQERKDKSPVAEHKKLGHETGAWSEDSCSVRDGNLVFDGYPYSEETIWVEGYDKFKWIDLTKAEDS